MVDVSGVSGSSTWSMLLWGFYNIAGRSELVSFYMVLWICNSLYMQNYNIKKDINHKLNS